MPRSGKAVTSTLTKEMYQNLLEMEKRTGLKKSVLVTIALQRFDLYLCQGSNQNRPFGVTSK